MPSECIEIQSLWNGQFVHRAISVGEIAVELAASCDDVVIGPGLEQFCADRGNPNIQVGVHWERSLRASRGKQVFRSGAVWSLSRDGADLVFDFCSPTVNEHPYKQLLVNEDFSRAQLLLSHEALDAYRPISPLEYPADELLITNYLAAHGFGVEVHGCGLVDSETGGHLFLGHSGAGKSTTARLWKSLRSPEILSDDRLILRIENGELWMHGTPWHGEGCFASPSKSRIDKILILQHGEENLVSPLSPSRAAGELFARCFPPFHSPAGLQRTIEFLDRVVSTVACSEFRFVPDERAVQAVIEMSHADAAS